MVMNRWWSYASSFFLLWFLWSGEVGEKSADQGKSKYQDAKVNKDGEKNLNWCTQTAYNSSKFCMLLVPKIFWGRLRNFGPAL